LFLEAFFERRFIGFRLSESQLSVLFRLRQILLTAVHYLDLRNTQKQVQPKWRQNEKVWSPKWENVERMN